MIIRHSTDIFSFIPQPKTEGEGDNIKIIAPPAWALIHLAQHPHNLEIISQVTGDIGLFQKTPGVKYTQVDEMPAGFLQICLNPKFGTKLTLQQILMHI